MTANNLKQMIKKKFPCKVGFVKARIFDELRENLNKYQEINGDLKLNENNIDRRINPYLIYQDVKTIIVTIFPYESHDKTIENKSHVVSRSSWGLDYHYVIKDKLNEIMGILNDKFQKDAVILVDNHPLHERHLAYLAGLGNFGKNTLLINPEYGSYFFISLILTDLELDEYNKPLFIDICKDCNRCIKACPTQAISDNRFIDAKRCMSYLTQSKDKIPQEFLSKFTKFSFGCDFCQISCVYNNKVDLPILKELKPSGREVIRVKDLEKLTNRTFNDKYGTISASFRGKNVLLRNAILISANRNDIEDLENIDDIDYNQNQYLEQAINYARSKKDKGEN